MHKQSKTVFENDNKVTSDFDHFQCESKLDWLFVFKRLAQLFFVVQFVLPVTGELLVI